MSARSPMTLEDLQHVDPFEQETVHTERSYDHSATQDGEHLEIEDNPAEYIDMLRSVTDWEQLSSTAWNGRSSVIMHRPPQAPSPVKPETLLLNEHRSDWIPTESIGDRPLLSNPRKKDRGHSASRHANKMNSQSPVLQQQYGLYDNDDEYTTKEVGVQMDLRLHDEHTCLITNRFNVVEHELQETRSQLQLASDAVQQLLAEKEHFLSERQQEVQRDQELIRLIEMMEAEKTNLSNELQKCRWELEARDRLIADKNAYLKDLQTQLRITQEEAFLLKSLKSPLVEKTDSILKRVPENQTPPKKDAESSHSIEKQLSPSVDNGNIDKKLIENSAMQAELLRTPSPKARHEDFKDLLKHQDLLESQLGQLVAKKSHLSNEYTRLPSAGGSASVRRRREVVERELDDVERVISSTRMRLKSIHAL